MSAQGFDSVPVYAHLSRRGAGLPWPHPVPRPPDSAFDGRHVCMLANMTYTTEAGQVHCAPRGMVSDGGTIRTACGWLLASTPFRDWLPAYLIHDRLCDEAEDIARDAEMEFNLGALPAARQLLREAIRLREYGDGVLREAAIWQGCRHAEVWRIHRAVRIGAWAAFRDLRKLMDV